MRRSWMVIAALVAGLFARASSATAEDEKILNIGDAAPALAVSSWIKGDKVEKFEPGKTYVVEFWATWCGPCRASIPHLTQLAHQYKDKGVRFIGVDVFEHDLKGVQPFVDEMGDKMDYSVGLDSVPENGEPNDGTMAKTWMKAAEEHGIPSAFVIRDGKITWIGHPMDLEEPLAKITAGEWDTSELAKKRLVKKLVEREEYKVRAKLESLEESKDYKGVVALIDEATKGNEEFAKELAFTKFIAMCKAGEIDAALPLGTKLLEDNKDNAGLLNNVAWEINPDAAKTVDPRIVKLALAAAKHAVELTHNENPSFLDSLAGAQFRSGDIEGAIVTEEKVIELSKSNDKYSDNDRQYFNERLARYRKAAAKKAEKS